MFKHLRFFPKKIKILSKGCYILHPPLAHPHHQPTCAARQSTAPVPREERARLDFLNTSKFFFPALKNLLYHIRQSVAPIWVAAMALSGCQSSDKAVAETATAKAAALTTWGQEALAFTRAKGFNQDWCLLIDLGLHSGKNRLFVYDLQAQKVLRAALVSHGCGLGGIWGVAGSKTNPRFSNEEDTHLSSLGKYKIGARGPSQWGIGIKYLLHGLEPTNSNALKRTIVLHGWDAIAEKEVFPAGTPEGWGCPAVSNGMMRYLDGMLKGSGGEVLMWVKA